MRSHSGLFITFEGLDGSGSNHYAEALSRLLSRQGYRVTFTHEPTNGMIGGLVKARVAGEWEIAPETLQLLFTADRSENLRTKILPALDAGRIVISDRYILSALAYNVVLVNDPKWLAALNSRFIWPDLTFLIEVSPKLCARRVKERRMEIELYSEQDKLERVWQEYQRLASTQDHIYKINGERDDVAIIDEIAEIARSYLNTKSMGERSRSYTEARY
ncbi:dTMP kinase [Candidatus Berkelbacteria bacterium]|nr:dTMP kinase [Candidatus Berkelbacteria bacterium]